MTDESIFARALAIPDLTDRAVYLDGVCGGNAELRREIEALLSAHAASNALDRPPHDIGATGSYIDSSNDSEKPGDRVGPYKLLEKIGEGGMGEVWVADQAEPIKRRVALKLIKPGMDSKQVLARFEAERQALALMDHPNIARVLDAGTSSEGRPYFVMELVKGTPITTFCDARKLSPRERLKLFVDVCSAIQHAHHKGVIHRDIKPSNVLVALYDDVPVVKVIDFGVAKAVGQPLTEKTLYTGFGALVGTPMYMAPEQASFNALDVDTRADVYALGVLLYELLTGSPPLEPERLRQAALDEVLRVVREEEPPRPSQRLSTSQAKASIAANRGVDVTALARSVRGELDWIAMRALEKDRSRRYGSPSALAKDVEHHLSGEPVEACPPTWRYRAGKFLRKHRAAIATATVFVVLLLAATGVSIGFAWVAARERDAANHARDEARQQAHNARQTARYFWNEVVSQASPIRQPDPNVTIRSLVNGLNDRLLKDHSGLEPVVDASVRKMMAELMMETWETDKARQHLETALPMLREQLGHDHEDVMDLELIQLITGSQAGDRPAIDGLKSLHAHQARILGENHPTTMWTLNILGWAMARMWAAPRDYEPYLARSAEFFINQEAMTAQKVYAVTNYTGFSLTPAHMTRATEYANRLIEQGSRIHKDHAAVLFSQQSLVVCRLDEGDTQEAIRLAKSAEEGFCRTFGESSIYSIAVRSHLVEALQEERRYAEAEPYLKMQRTFADPAVAKAMEFAWQVLEATNRAGLGDPTGALADLKDLEKAAEPAWAAVLVRSLRGECLTALKQFEQAEPLLLESWQQLKAQNFADTPFGRRYLRNMATRIVTLYDAWGKPQQTNEWREKLHALKENP